MRPAERRRVLAFDLGGVVCHFAPAARLKRLLDLTGAGPHDLQDALWGSGLDHRAEEGELSLREVYDEIRVALHTTATDAELRSAWSLAFEPNPGVLNLVEVIDEVCVLFTNNGPIVTDCLANELQGVADAFVACWCSWQLGHRKPDRRAFEGLLDRVAVDDPEELIFIDDSRENVDAAFLLGIDAIRYSTDGNLRAELRRRGVI